MNPWLGCTKVSEACRFCYAEVSTPSRAFGIEWGPGKERQRTSEANWKKPLNWNRKAKEAGERRRVFCASLADVFDEEVDDQWREDLFDLVGQTPHLDWLILTKRPEIAKEYVEANGNLGKNVWLGVSVEDQKTADERIPILLQTPAAIHWVSYEPALGPIDFLRIAWPERHQVDVLRGGYWDNDPESPLRGTFVNHSDFPAKLSWIICGGESGSSARPFDVRWARETVKACAEANVACFVKQLGGYVRWDGTADHAERWPDGTDTEDIGGAFRVHLCDKKGGDMVEWPEGLRVREFPFRKLPDFVHASGEVDCNRCGKLYREHPHDEVELSYANEPYLRILCDGTRVKL